MPSLHKSFVPNEILTADDLNSTCNPTTADHIPYAVADGAVSAGQRTGAYYTQKVAFPAGRFTRPPTVTATSSAGQAAGASNIIVTIGNVSASGFDLTFWAVNGSLGSGWCQANWQAIQMSK